MDRQIAFILAGATVALGIGGYLMSESTREYDLDKSAKSEAARLERLEEGDTAKGPGLFSALMDKVAVKLETSRNVYLGEHFPPTPEGWVLKKTHHDEIVDFTVDYAMTLDINDKSSMRRLSGWGASTTVRSTDLAYRNGDKVIFMRLVFANKPIEKPVRHSAAWLLGGVAQDGPEQVLGGVTFKTRQHEQENIINIASVTGHYTAVGILSNASLAEVEALMDSMDIAAFGGLTGNPAAGSSVVPFWATPETNELQTMETISAEPEAEVERADPKPSPKGNLIAGLPGKDEEAEDMADEPKKKKKSKNLLSSLLGGGEDSTPIFRSKSKKKKSKSGGSFQKVGNFTSRCKSGNGAKVCSVSKP